MKPTDADPMIHQNAGTHQGERACADTHQGGWCFSHRADEIQRRAAGLGTFAQQPADHDHVVEPGRIAAVLPGSGFNTPHGPYRSLAPAAARPSAPHGTPIVAYVPA